MTQTLTKANLCIANPMVHGNLTQWDKPRLIPANTIGYGIKEKIIGNKFNFDFLYEPEIVLRCKYIALYNK